VVSICRYARDDTHYLLHIYDLMRLRLIKESTGETDNLLEVNLLLTGLFHLSGLYYTKLLTALLSSLPLIFSPGLIFTDQQSYMILVGFLFYFSLLC
jgi:hypothetical protein